ncbi:MAG: hypothetical protein GXY77_08435, partial [Fibrobacter sp.]|nr:hypothetical protein [Fibrobacter sp.]
MAKEKVYKLAQEFKVSSEALVQMLRGMGIQVKSHMSTVDESLRNDIKKKFEQERAEIKKEYERKKQMLTRAREELIGREEEQESQKSVEKSDSGSEKNVEKSDIKPKEAKPHVSHRRFGRSEQPSRERTYISPEKTVSKDMPATPLTPNKTAEDKSGARKDKKKKSKKRSGRPEINEIELKANIKKTLAKIGSG